MFQIPDHLRPLRDRVLRFTDEHIVPNEQGLDRPWAEALPLLTELRDRAKAEGLWALGHPADIGGGGLAMGALHEIAGGGKHLLLQAVDRHAPLLVVHFRSGVFLGRARDLGRQPPSGACAPSLRGVGALVGTLTAA